MATGSSAVEQTRTAILRRVEAGIAEGPFSAEWDSLVSGYRVPDWYVDGKFGIFIHWGPYSVPAYSAANGTRATCTGRARGVRAPPKTYRPAAKFGYKDFIPMFTAEKFDRWSGRTSFAGRGPQFVVPVAEHHDGFAMYDSDLSRWNAAQDGAERDVVGELAGPYAHQGHGLRRHPATAPSTGGSSTAA